jgi:hypothetical protein
VASLWSRPLRACACSVTSVIRKPGEQRCVGLMSAGGARTNEELWPAGWDRFGKVQRLQFTGSATLRFYCRNESVLRGQSHLG